MDLIDHASMNGHHLFANRQKIHDLLWCLMLHVQFFNHYHHTSGIQNSCDRTHGTLGSTNYVQLPPKCGLVASLTVVLSWWFPHVLFLSSWFSHGGSLMVVLSWWFSHVVFSHDGSLMVFLSRCHSQLFFVYTLFLSRFLTWVHRLISFMEGSVSE